MYRIRRSSQFSLEIEKNNDNNAKSEEFESISHVTNHSNVEDQNT